MPAKLKLIGTPASPFVRKILAILALKELACEVDPVIAFYTDDTFTRVSPLRRIPVLIHGETVISDSSVIAAYLEEIAPSPAILPEAPADRAKARWIEEFADSRMADVFLWRCFYAAILKPSVWGEERDLGVLKEEFETSVPEIMDFLEAAAPEDGFLWGDIGLADISVAVMFRNMRYVRWTPDIARWPRTARWVEACEAHPALAAAIAWSDELIRTPIAEQRARAAEIGVPVMAETYFRDQKARRGPMTVSG